MVLTWAPDDLWEIAGPLIPAARRRVQGGGRRRVDDRAVLAAIVYVTQAGCSWWKLPGALFGVGRATAHRRFTEWTRAGLWERDPPVTELMTRFRSSLAKLRDELP